MKYIVLTLFFCLIAADNFAQEVLITGIVIDNITDEPILGANVRIKGTTQGTTTDIEGNFSLKVPSSNVTLVFTYVGYAEQEQIIDATQVANKFNVKLEPSVMLLERAVVSGSRYEKKLSEETVSLEIISPEAIESLGLNNAAEAIERTPGVTIIDGQPNIRGGAGYAYGAGSRVLLLVDDIPALQADAGRPNWGHIPIENLGQIEIIKGASSALYGSSAMNGIINARTAFPGSEPYTHFALFGTIFNRPANSENLDGEEIKGKDKKWWEEESLIIGDSTVDVTQFSRPRAMGFILAHRRKIKQLDVVFGANVSTTQGVAFGNYGSSGRVNANLRYRFKNKPGMNIGLSTNVQAGNNGNFFLWAGDGAGLYVPGALSGVPTTTKGFNLTLDPYYNYSDEKGNRHKVLGRYLKIDNYNTNDQSNFSNYYYGEYQYQRRQEKIDMNITAGAVASFNLVKAPLYGDTTLRARNVAIYTQIDKKFFNRLNVSLGLRLENNKITLSPVETRPVVRVGLNFEAAEYTFLRASFGQGYRFPTIAEKFVQTALGDIGIGQNLDLESETGLSAEIGLKQGLKLGKNFNALFDVSIFYNEYSNMMEFGVDEVGGSDFFITFRSRNVGDTRIYGVEATIGAEGKVGEFPTNLILGYNWIDPKFKNFSDSIVVGNSFTPYNVLKYRFRHTFVADYSINFNGLELGVSGRFYSFMENVDAVFSSFLPGIADFRVRRLRDENLPREDWGPRSFKGDFVLDARIAYSFGSDDQAKIGFIVKNLLNHEYSLRPGRIENPRDYTLRLDVKF